MSHGSYRVRPPVTVKCGGCPRTVTDTHPNPSTGTALLVAQVTYGWGRLTENDDASTLYCPDCQQRNNA